MIKDSGERREFASGAVRDIQDGKGRFDLMPLREMSEIMFDTGIEAEVIRCIEAGLINKDDSYFVMAVKHFCKGYMNGIPNGMLELAKHYENGAKKYGEYNWQKGIPCHCYIDSALRHLCKFLRGDNDEPHNAAFVWNIVCLIWTIRNRPECNDLWEEEK